MTPSANREADDEVNHLIGTGPEDYSSFFDHNWAREFLALADGTKISGPAFDLCTDWKGAANTFRMPWLFVHSLDDFQKGFMQGREPFWEKLTRGLRDHILNKMGSNLSNMKRKELVSIIDEISREAQETIARTPPPFQMGPVWAAFSQNKEFALALWGCQRLCYSALYHAYENFLRRCVAEARGDPHYRPHWKMLRRDLDALMPPNMGAECLDDGHVAVARLARDTLDHNGGMETAELREMRHGLAVLQGRIEPLPADIRALFDLLKTKVTRVAERVRTLPELQC
jgi:hypothetical protein